MEVRRGSRGGLVPDFPLHKKLIFWVPFAPRLSSWNAGRQPAEEDRASDDTVPAALVPLSSVVDPPSSSSGSLRVRFARIGLGPSVEHSLKNIYAVTK